MRYLLLTSIHRGLGVSQNTLFLFVSTKRDSHKSGFYNLSNFANMYETNVFENKVRVDLRSLAGLFA